MANDATDENDLTRPSQMSSSSPPRPPHPDQEPSAIWQRLPMELVVMVLDYFIKDILAPCCPGAPYFEMTNLSACLCEIWGSFRRDPLFKYQKRLIERHFLINWLRQTTIYLFVDDLSPGYHHLSMMMYYCRYLPFSESLLETMLEDVTGMNFPRPVAVIPDKNGNPESQKATFFLHADILDDAGAAHIYYSVFRKRFNITRRQPFPTRRWQPFMLGNGTAKCLESTWAFEAPNRKMT